ncbi:Predicted ATPase (AAA+ superfamily) [hydrothermal vent metagenome]|uniref:Predicted ATPase (AAA+ superfamily) n=1 Tax=hydrothermal vent metagenome TaxID=652676 RepID=A0A3B1E1T1_9ZZZZ
MNRNIDDNLLEWKISKQRKVLLLRGARQVGKTYSCRVLGESFKYFLEINFEEEKDVKKLFERTLNPAYLSEKLSAYFSIPIIPGQTLLFFDEIQACPDALSSLRFFYEKMPDLHVIAAGSLLEIVLSNLPSYGVGRIQSFFMYPLSFDEYLKALGEDKLIDMKNDQIVETIFHDKIIDYLKIFYLIGGLPEIVNEYITTRNILECQKLLGDLLESFRDDFAKYKRRVNVQLLNEVFNSIAVQSGGKFKYSNVDGAYNHRALKEALDLLVQAGLAYKVYHSSGAGVPLGSGIKHNRFKIFLFDLGVHFRLLGLNNADILLANDIDMINKGSIAEVFVGQEFIKSMENRTRAQLFYWHNEQKGTSSEVDYLIQKGDQIIPIEVKSGKTGKMKSMQVFLKQHNAKHGIRLSLENFSQYERTSIIPLYATNTI